MTGLKGGAYATRVRASCSGRLADDRPMSRHSVIASDDSSLILTSQFRVWSIILMLLSIQMSNMSDLSLCHFNADMKCSRQRLSVSSSGRHGDPSDLWMVVPVISFLFSGSSQIALKAGPRWFCPMPVSSSSQRLFKKTLRSCLALALNTPCKRLCSTVLF